MSALPQQSVHLNTTRLEEVSTDMPPYRPTAPTMIGWRSIEDHTVGIRQQYDLFGFRLWIADERGYYRQTITSAITYPSEEAAIDAARAYLEDAS